jgi:hypothetical protein
LSARTRPLHQQPLYKDQVRNAQQGRKSTKPRDGYSTIYNTQAGAEYEDSTTGESIAENICFSAYGIEEVRRESNDTAESDALVAELVMVADVATMAVAEQVAKKRSKNISPTCNASFPCFYSTRSFPDF